MSWDDAALLESELKSALDTFNWPEAEAICQRIIGRIMTEPDLIPEATAKRLLQNLRRKRRLNLMTSLADAMVQSGLRSPQVRRQYAQALIDQGALGAGEILLQSIIRDSQGVIGEELEARGLTGRIYKQLYINNNDPTSARNRTHLARALNEYLHVYQLNPYEYLWHGINVVALSARARRDKLPPTGQPDAAAMAQDILAALDERESKSNTGSLPAWDVATRLEAYVALGLHEKTQKGAADYFRKAEGEALRYIASADADAFEINSTIRQFTEVWQLDDKQPPGDHLLPILRAGHLRKLGAATEKDPKKVEEEAAVVANAINDLEATFGSDGIVTLKWYKKGLEQCNSVARVERLSGKGHGTGWLVKASDFFPGKAGVLLLTNAHVVSDYPNPFTNPLAISPSNAQVNFQAAGNGEVYRVAKKVFWTSSPDELDATFLELSDQPSAGPLTLDDQKVRLPEPPPSEPDKLPRLYVIGHPNGRDLELSLQDNRLLACNDRLIHYRTPTERGSSGSPVFEHEDWRVVALHHKGSGTMRRINGEGTYEANEGIAIQALREATRNSQSSQ
jgi:Trypsin-like peptidase domain/MAP3K TRAFs-binding domain